MKYNIKRIILFGILIIAVALPGLKAQITRTVSFDPTDLTISTITGEDNIIYNKIKVNDLSVNGTVGSPELPVKYIKLIIPTDKDAGTIVINQTNKTTYALDNLVYPIQTPKPVSMNNLPPAFVEPDPTIYNSSNPYPESMVKIVEQGYFDGKTRIVTIAICPFQYYPTLNKLEYYSKINFTLSFVNSTTSGIQVNKRLVNSQKLYDGVLKTLVENTEDIAQYQVKALNLTDSMNKIQDSHFYQYVIITNNCYRDKFNDFVQWKKRKGIDVGVVTIEDIDRWGYTGDLLHPTHPIMDEAGKIRHYLRDGYVNGTFYALLAWKIDQDPLPIRYGYPYNYDHTYYNEIPNDAYFTEFNNDWKLDGDDYYGEPEDNIDLNPEIYVGRLLINAPQDIENWTKKIKIYEQNPGNGNYSYLSRLFWMQADEMQGYNSYGYVSGNLSMFQSTVWGEYPYCYSQYDDNGMVVGSNPPIYGNTKGANIISEMNSNYGLISLSCHGGTGGGESGCSPMSSGYCASPYWKIEAEDIYGYPAVRPEVNNAIDNLTNFNFPSIIYTISCDLIPYNLTKSYGNQVPNTDAFGRNTGESFTVNNLAGGVAFLGNTRDGHMVSSETLFNYFAQYIKSAHELPNNGFYGHLGIAEGMSKSINSNNYINYTHNLIGCPETEIWTGTPTIFDASVTPSMILLNNAQDVTVNINNLLYNKPATICLYNGAEIFSTYEVTGDANNHASHTFTNVTPQCINNIQVTITSYNYIPYMTDILVSDCIFSSTPMDITQDITWNVSRMINQNVYIKNGATLTIPKNVKIAFNSQAKMIVEPGGKLIVDGGDLTNGCSEVIWGGIEVQGNPNQAQTQMYQGYVELKNGATIENAFIGVHCVLNAYLPAKESVTSYASGGIINANGAIFKNNSTAINIEHWTNMFSNYVSDIVSCSFFYPNAIYPQDAVPGGPTYILLTGVKGVNIFTNTFTGNANNAFTLRGNAIVANDATFNLNNPNFIAPNPNIFNNMTYGIRCLNTNAIAKPEISLTQFNNNFHSIYLSGVIDAKVLKNTINFKSFNLDNKAYGIYLDNCNNYHVEGNLLSSSVKTGKPEYGIIINNSGIEYNQIYRNVFTDIIVPINAQNNNRSDNGYNGLELLCNRFISTATNDIVVTTEEEGNNKGIRLSQGTLFEENTLLSRPASNLFNYSTSGPVNYVNNSGNPIYYVCAGPSTVTYQNVLYNNIPRIDINADITLQYTGIAWTITDWENIYCRDWTINEEGGKSLLTINRLKEQIKVLQPQIDYATNVLLQKMDNGNTTNLINRINLCSSMGYSKLYGDLHQYSPYLSENVLLAVIKKQDFPASLLVNLMLLNTHVAKTPWLMEALQQVTPPLSATQLQQIQDKINVFSTMEIDRLKIADLLVQRDYDYNTVEHYYAHDSLPVSNDSLVMMLQNDPRLAAKYQLVYLYFAKNDFTLADQLLNQIPQLFVFNEKQQNEYNNYKQLYELKLQLHNEGKDYNDLDKDQQQMLINVINHPSLSLTEMNDLNALRQANETTNGLMGIIGEKSLMPVYVEPIIDPVVNNEKVLGGTTIDDLLMEGLMDKVLMRENGLSVYPNPAVDEINILYNVTSDASNISIEIMDITGRSIGNYTVAKNNNSLKINTQSFKKGIYYVMLVIDGKKCEFNKLVIQ